jgi:hypothetical protein
MACFQSGRNIGWHEVGIYVNLSYLKQLGQVEHVVDLHLVGMEQMLAESKLAGQQVLKKVDFFIISNTFKII